MENNTTTYNKSLYHWQGNNNLLNTIEEFNDQKNKIVRFLDTQFHNKKLNIFIGSGCSTPSVPLMGKTIKSILSKEENIEIKNEIQKYIDISNEELPKNEELNIDNFGDIEGFLTWLGKGIDFEKDKTLKDKYKKIYDSLKMQFIATMPKANNEKYSDNETTSHYWDFYKYIFQKRKEDFPKLNVFTTNYDLYTEYTFENHNIHYTTGFNMGLNQNFNINNFNYRIVDSRERYKDKWQPTSKEANLYKLHGSINWIQKNGILLQSDNPNEDIESVIVYPTVLKHQETTQTPYAELFREFSIQLQKPNSTLIVLGYGFGDGHINNIISQNLSNSDFTLIVFGDIEEKGLKKFKDFNNKNINFHIIGGITCISKKAHFFSEIIKHFCTNNHLKGECNE